MFLTSFAVFIQISVLAALQLGHSVFITATTAVVVVVVAAAAATTTTTTTTTTISFQHSYLLYNIAE